MRRQSRSSARRAGHRQRGLSLIFAMLMLVLIGLASLAILRNAVSADQVVTNDRLLAQARQFAQLALRFCERQLTLSASTRAVVTLDARTPPAWTQQTAWRAGPAALAHALVAPDFSGEIRPVVAPQCLIEATAAPEVFTVTARGFSPDFGVDPFTGAPRSGSVVWLQSTVQLSDRGAAIRQRAWQQLLTPPF